MGRAWLLALALLVPVVGANAAQTPDETAAPLPWWERTMLDLDGDGLDDALWPLLGTSAPLVVLVDYATHPSAAQKAALVRAGATIVAEYEHFPLLAVRVVPTLLPRLAASDGVVLVEANDVLTKQLKESVPLIGAPLAWDRYDVTGAGVTIAVLDDGAFESHPDLAPRLHGHYDANVPSTPLGGAAPVEVVAPAGEDGHGTHVAGTIVGTGGESRGAYKGVAPGARFANVKVFSGPNQTTSDLVLKGLDWTLKNKDALDIRVASLSLGGRPSDGTDALSRSVDIATDKGLVVVAAAGNTGDKPQTVSSPGAAAKAITVGAVDKRKVIAKFSGRGPTLDGRTKPDLVAPGVGIVSTVPPASTGATGSLLGGRGSPYYGALSGSSMATPHVSGVAALMLEANPSLTPRQVKTILLATAQDVGPRGIDNDTGFGFVNAVAAVQVANDPSILQQARFQTILEAIPDPPPASLLDLAAFEVQRMVRGEITPRIAGSVAAAAIGVGLLVYLGLTGRRQA